MKISGLAKMLALVILALSGIACHSLQPTASPDSDYGGHGGGAGGHGGHGGGGGH